MLGGVSIFRLRVGRLVVWGLTALAAAFAVPASAQAQSDAVGGSRSIIRIPATATLPVTRQLTIGLNKAVIIELPQDSHDVIVSQAETIDATVHTARRIMVYGKAIGSGNVFVLGRDGRQILVLDVTIKRDLSELEQMLRRLLPNARISASSSGDGVVLSGNVTQPADSTRAEEIAKQYMKSGTVVNLLTVSEREQVMLKVTVAEIQRESVRRLGVDLPQAVASAGAFTFGKVIQNAFPVSTAVAGSALFNPKGAPLLASGNALQTTANWNGNTATAMIQSLERVGLGRTLAEPTLTAISGETAKFLAGGEFPIPVATQDKTITVSWKQFGVNVAFTPFVLTEGRINLKISAEVSELSTQGSVSTGGISIQGLQVRRAETTVEMPSGAALAIAGLLSDQTRQSVEGVPELRNLPVLGALFRSKDFRNNQSELVIIVTPIIVRPTESSQLSRPDEGFAPATDLKGLFRGHVHRIYNASPRIGANLVNDDFGYIVEYPDHGGVK